MLKSFKNFLSSFFTFISTLFNPGKNKSYIIQCVNIDSKAHSERVCYWYDEFSLTIRCIAIQKNQPNVINTSKISTKRMVKNHDVQPLDESDRSLQRLLA